MAEQWVVKAQISGTVLGADSGPKIFGLTALHYPREVHILLRVCLCAWFLSQSPIWFSSCPFGFLQGPLQFGFSPLTVGWSIGWTSETVNRWVEKKNKLSHWSFSASVSSSGPDLMGLGAAWAWGVESSLDILVCDRVGELGRNLCWFLPYWVSTKNGIPCI